MRLQRCSQGTGSRLRHASVAQIDVLQRTHALQNFRQICTAAILDDGVAQVNKLQQCESTYALHTRCETQSSGRGTNLQPNVSYQRASDSGAAAAADIARAKVDVLEGGMGCDGVG
jgi:hypothetical protein